MGSPSSDFGVTANSTLKPKWDGVGVFYAIFSIVWTAILFGAMAFLYVRRDMPILKVRGLALSFGAVLMMHCYWLAVELGYIYAALMPEIYEFWIMGVWFPFGIALFHASNSRFLYVARAQQQYLNEDMKQKRQWRLAKPRSLFARFQQMDYNKKMLVLVSIGMGFQLFLTTFMFLISRKFHSSFGIPGTEVHGTYMEQKTQAGRGWEWWPSVFWQLFWAWIFAPMILWQARHVRDTQGWRFQTIACCISNLPAAPMWLVALYVPAMSPVNAYWIPPQWLATSIMFLEIFTIFVPCWEVYVQTNLTHDTLESIARWESRQKTSKGNCEKSLTSSSTTSSWMPRTGRASSVHSSGSSVLTMEALEHTLAKNPEPLQEFSALRDFSGENIAFLTRVRDWRTMFFPTRRNSDVKQAVETTITREAFESALNIYLDFISPSAAEFQVNLSSPDFKSLQAVFEEAAHIMYGDRRTPDPATPFEDWSGPRLNDAQTSSTALEQDSGSESTTLNIRFWGDIPEAFDEHVFDEAEGAIKYLVLTNTWPKFIKERRSLDYDRSLESGQ